MATPSTVLQAEAAELAARAVWSCGSQSQGGTGSEENLKQEAFLPPIEAGVRTKSAVCVAATATDKFR